jgi:nicotinic acid phosphoribosyltransferase
MQDLNYPRLIGGQGENLISDLDVPVLVIVYKMVRATAHFLGRRKVKIV